MPLQTLPPDALLLQTSLTGTVADIDEDPDAPDASFLLAPALQSAAAQTLYFNDALQGAGYGMLSTPPATANFHGSITGSGWQTGTTAARYGWLDYFTQVARTALVATEPTATIVTTANAGNFFRAPAAYSGSFPSGNWTLNMDVRGTAQADFALRWHVFASTDPTGADAAQRRQLNSSVIVSSTITATLSTTSTNVPATWAAPAVTLNNEYLFFTPYVHIVGVTGAANTHTIYLVKASTSRVLTTVFTPKEPDTRARVSFPTPTYSLTSGAGLQEFRCLVRKKGAGTSPTAQLALYENGALVSNLGSAQSVTNTTGQVISGTFDAAGRNMTQIEADVLGTGAVGGSVEVGAFEWNADTTIQSVAGGYLGDGATLNGVTIAKLAVNTDLRVSFPTPPDQLVVGGVLQDFRVLVRKTAGTGTPTVRLELHNAGSFVSTVLADTSVTSASGQVVSGTFSASLLPNLTGDNVELRVYGSGIAGGATVEVGAIEWNAQGFTAQIIAGDLGDGSRLLGPRIAGDNTAIAGGSLGDGAQLFGPQVQGPVLQAGFLGALRPGRYPASSKWVPASIASEHQLFGVTISSGASGGQERVKPNQILALAGLSGVVADIDDDPDDPDQTFLEVG